MTETVAISPAAALLLQGRTLHQQGALAAARQLYDQALVLDPHDVDAHYLLAVLAVAAGDHSRAQNLLLTACELNPQHGACAYLLGHVLRSAGQPLAALAWLDRANELTPGHALVWRCRAQALLDLERYADALQACDQALLLDPGALDAHFARGGALTMMGRYAEALLSYDQVLAIDPRHATCHSNRAQTLIRLAKAEGCDDALLPALHHLKQSLAIQPHQPDTHRLCGGILRRLGEFNSAITYYEEAVRQDPANHAAHYGLAACWLSQGDWARGWEKFEHRPLLEPDYVEVHQISSARLWRGEPLQGKSIVLVAEGGFGDVLHFFRYVRLASERGARVSVVLPQELRSLLGHAQGAGRAGQSGTDYYCPMMSLPLAFGTRPDTVPAAHGYIQADAAKASQWAQRLPPRRKLRVGLAWSGNPQHLNDHNRSMPLAQLTSLLDEADVAYCCLQKVVRDEDREALDSLPQLAFFGNELKDFDDTAALCEAMDLIICVDTSVAHLAGALGKPVWIMLPAVAEYRWMMHREDTPWYAKARLFRQPRRGDWTQVVARVRSELRLLLAGRVSPGVPAGATTAEQTPY